MHNVCYILTHYGHIKTAEQWTVFTDMVIGTLVHLVQRGGTSTAGCGPAQSPHHHHHHHVACPMVDVAVPTSLLHATVEDMLIEIT